MIKNVTDQPTNRRTNQPTNEPTDRRVELPMSGFYFCQNVFKNFVITFT